MQGAKDNKDNNAAAGKETRSVSLQLPPEQVKTIAVAKDLGKLSLAIRAAVEHEQTRDAGTMFGCDVSPEIARQSAIANESATVVVYGGDKPKEYSVKKHDPAGVAPVWLRSARGGRWPRWDSGDLSADKGRE